MTSPPTAGGVLSPSPLPEDVTHRLGPRERPGQEVPKPSSLGPPFQHLPPTPAHLPQGEPTSACPQPHPGAMVGPGPVSAISPRMRV